MPATRRQAKESLCPKCGVAFSCGMVAGEAHCWCADLPKLMPLDVNANTCFCSTCLELEIAARSTSPIET